MGRAPCCDKSTVKKGPWSPEEDAKLKDFIHRFGTGGNWITLPHKAGLKRCGKSCRLRWLNYLRPNIKHGEFSDEEDRIIYSLYSTIGSRFWIMLEGLRFAVFQVVDYSGAVARRTDNDIKNYWNTKLKKKLISSATGSNMAGKLQLLTQPPVAASTTPHFSPAVFYGEPSSVSDPQSSFFFNTLQTDYQNLMSGLRNQNSCSGYQFGFGVIKREDGDYFVPPSDQDRNSFPVGGGFGNVNQQPMQLEEVKQLIDSSSSSSSGIHGCDDTFLYYY